MLISLKEGFCWQVEDEIDDCNVDVPIKYLHQLQNIYFTLTGTELNVEKDICENVKSRGNSAFCLSFQTDRIKK